MARLLSRALPRGIQARLFLLIAVVLVPMALELGWTNLQRYISLRDIRLQSETEVAQGIATAFGAYVSGHREHLHVTGQAILAFSSYPLEKATNLLNEGAEHSPAIRNLSWVSIDGTVLASTVPALVGRNLSVRSYFQEIVAGSSWVLSDLHPRGSVTDSPVFFIAAEARDEAGDLQGVVVAAIGPEEVGHLTLSQERPSAGRLALFDRQGTVVYLSPALSLSWEERGLWRQTDRLLQQAIDTGQAQAGTTTVVALEGRWVAARVPITSIGWVAGAARPVDVAFAPLRETIIRDTSMAVLITFLALLLAYFLAQTIARPLLRLELATRKMGEGEIGEIDDPQAPLEVQSLGSTLSTMAANLLTAKEAAEKASRAKSEFLANMSHELRTPMSVIMGALEFLQKSAPTPEQRKLLDLSSTSAQRLLGIIDDLLDISRIEAGRIKIEERSFDLRECVRQVMEMFSPSAREKGLRLSWQVAPHLPGHVMSDPDRLTQVLINLVGNAVKFTERGEISLNVQEVGAELVFMVQDTGIGIPGDKIDQIFQPFTQVDSSLTKRHRGTGLGLAISRELVVLMGGTINVKSREGEGSLFSFSIPLRPAELVDESSRVETTPKTGSRPIRILLAEDEPSVRDMVTMTLEGQGMAVTIAETGLQAVAKWKEEKFDLILMDLQMPEMDGLEATRLIRELECAREEKTCIFALTAHVRPEDRERCMSAGMNGCLAKPLRLEKMVSLIEKCPCGLHSAFAQSTLTP
jgi:signal transduction histidine kinase/ActR/RegA family two-component response regulator